MVSLTRLKDTFARNFSYYNVDTVSAWIYHYVEAVLLTFRVSLLYLFSDRSRFQVSFAFGQQRSTYRCGPVCLIN